MDIRKYVAVFLYAITYISVGFIQVDHDGFRMMIPFMVFGAGILGGLIGWLFISYDPL